MNTKLLKGIAAIVCTTGALALSFRSKSNVVELTKSVQRVASNKRPGLQKPEDKASATNEKPNVSGSLPTTDSNDRHKNGNSSNAVAETPETSNDPNSLPNRKAAGAHDDKLMPKPIDKPKPPIEPAPSRVLFAISSHTNFNVVPHGIIQVGGKGHPGDKVMLLIDNKPSMRGTVKPDGRWKFPIKIAKPGCRRITAQDLRSRESKSVKLRIK